jgi:hypothetical protein
MHSCNAITLCVFLISIAESGSFATTDCVTLTMGALTRHMATPNHKTAVLMIRQDQQARAKTGTSAIVSAMAAQDEVLKRAVQTLMRTILWLSMEDVALVNKPTMPSSRNTTDLWPLDEIPVPSTAAGGLQLP